ncbi:hypothetical protein RQP46_007519 [Phenoliferia psychrophenolica]
MSALVTRFVCAPVVRRLPVPTPGPSEMLIKVVCAAINPTDTFGSRLTFGGLIVGCEFSGIVSIPPLDPSLSSSFKKGDRVVSIAHGSHSTTSGAFAEYTLADPNLAWKVPEGKSAQECCEMNVNWMSALLVLKRFAKWAKEHGLEEEETPVLIYSAATSLGLQTTQLLRHLFPSRPVLALASPASHGLLSSLGASHCLAYSDPSLDSKVKALNLAPIQLALDAYSAGDSMVKCQRLMGETGLLVKSIPFGGKKPRKGIEVETFLAYSCGGKPFRILLKRYPAVPEDYTLAKEYFEILPKLIEEGKIVTLPYRVVDGGLAGVLEGFKMIKEGKVKAQKLVVEVSKPW